MLPDCWFTSKFYRIKPDTCTAAREDIANNTISVLANRGLSPVRLQLFSSKFLHTTRQDLPRLARRHSLNRPGSVPVSTPGNPPQWMIYPSRWLASPAHLRPLFVYPQDRACHPVCPYCGLDGEPKESVDQDRKIQKMTRKAARWYFQEGQAELCPRVLYKRPGICFHQPVCKEKRSKGKT